MVFQILLPGELFEAEFALEGLPLRPQMHLIHVETQSILGSVLPTTVRAVQQSGGDPVASSSSSSPHLCFPSVRVARQMCFERCIRREILVADGTLVAPNAAIDRPVLTREA